MCLRPFTLVLYLVYINNQINSLNPKLQTPLTKKQASRTRSQAQAKLQTPTSHH
jgi:hypothetical protein